MSNLLYYKYRAVLDERQKGLFDSLSECSAVVYNLTREFDTSLKISG